MKHLSPALQKAVSEARTKVLGLYRGPEIPGQGGDVEKTEQDTLTFCVGCHVKIATKSQVGHAGSGATAEVCKEELPERRK